MRTIIEFKAPKKNLDAGGVRKELFTEYQKGLENKKEFIKQVIELGKTKRIALLCFEANPKECHRGILSQELEKRGFPFFIYEIRNSPHPFAAGNRFRGHSKKNVLKDDFLNQNASALKPGRPVF